MTSTDTFPSDQQFRDDLAQISAAVKRHREIEALLPELVAALEPFSAFADAFEAKPLRGIDDALYSIHGGTEWEAILRLSDCQRAATAYARAKELLR